MSGRKKKFPRAKQDPDYVAEVGMGEPSVQGPATGTGTVRRGRGRPRKDGSSPIPRKKLLHPMLKERYPGGADDDSHVAMVTEVKAEGQVSLESQIPEALSGSVELQSTEIKSQFDDGQVIGSRSIDTLSFQDDDSRTFGDMGQFSGLSNDAISNEDYSFHSRSEGSDKFCALCCCGEKSLLGQGDLLRFDPTPGFNPFKKAVPKQRKHVEDSLEPHPNERSPKHWTWRRKRGPPKTTSRERSKSPRRSNPHSVVIGENGKPPLIVDELSTVGHPEEPDLSVVFEQTGHTTAHHCCAAWSEGVCQNENMQLINVDKAVLSGISQVCSYCKKHGATIVCRMVKCNKMYHYPCAASSGAFQEIKDMSLFCPDHLDQAEAIAEEEANCVVCDSPGDMMEQLFCTSCGQHYHGSCLDPAVDVNPVVRAGWQCPECKICQTCRQPGDDNKMLVCDTCDKGYHTFCLRPVMQTIPKNGWKCKNCRVCTDCGSRTPGSGPSSRWHLNYSVCDSCYQQRNKGLCCPICGKAYRQHTTANTMVQCDQCKKWIHAGCDDSVDMTTYQQMKAEGMNAVYNCLDCRSKDPGQEQYSDGEQPMEHMDNSSAFAAAAIDTDSNFTETDVISDTQQQDDDPDYIPPGVRIDPVKETAVVPSVTLEDSMETESHQSSQDTLINEDSINSADVDLQPVEKSTFAPQREMVGVRSAPSNVPATLSSPKGPGIGKPAIIKRIGAGRPRGRGVHIGKRRRHPGPPGKRGPKPKMKPSNVQPIQQTTSTAQDSGNEKKEEEDTGMHTTVVLFSVKDRFTLTQDMCVSCGSFGRGAEGRLLTCSQCGQCYHPYCVNIKITKVVLSKGWRCLDCTVCEGCGKASDEGRLLLCDDCDISYHTYCLNPPLENVPKGGWKCKWCVCCTHCGATSPGFNCSWQNNYTQCGPCASLITCCVCHKDYKEGDLIIHCVQCYRWLHSECDGFQNEDEIERAADQGYHCLLCRPATQPALKPLPPPEDPPQPSVPHETSKTIQTHNQQYSMEGVYLTESGFNQIKSLAITPPLKKKQPRSRNKFRPGSLSVLKELQKAEQAKLADQDVTTATALGEPMVLSRDSAGEHDEDKTEGSGVDDNTTLTDPSLLKKRKRRAYRPGIGGFVARPRGRGGLLNRMANRKISAMLDVDFHHQNADEGEMGGDEQGRPEPGSEIVEKKKKRRKRKSQLEHAFPAYLQEAFFGKSLLTSSKNKADGFESASDDDHRTQSSLAAMQPHKSLPVTAVGSVPPTTVGTTVASHTENVDGNDLGNTDDPLNFLPHDDELLGILMSGDLNKGTDGIDISAVTEDGPGATGVAAVPDRTGTSTDHITELDADDIDKMVTEELAQLDGKEMDEFLSGMLSPHEQTPGQQLPTEGTDIPFPGSEATTTQPGASPVTSQSLPPNQRPTPPATLPLQPSFPPQHPPPMPQHPGLAQDVSNSPVFSPDFAAPMSPWPGTPSSEPDVETLSYNQRNILKWEKDEPLGDMATISPVLYANMQHPDLRNEYPDWPTRAKQIAKLWRKATSDEKAPFLQRARENRAAQRLKDAQKVWRLNEGIQRKKAQEKLGGHDMGGDQIENPQLRSPIPSPAPVPSPGPIPSLMTPTGQLPSGPLGSGQMPMAGQISTSGSMPGQLPTPVQMPMSVPGQMPAPGQQQGQGPIPGPGQMGQNQMLSPSNMQGRTQGQMPGLSNLQGQLQAPPGQIPPFSQMQGHGQLLHGPQGPGMQPPHVGAIDSMTMPPPPPPPPPPLPMGYNPGLGIGRGGAISKKDQQKLLKEQKLLREQEQERQWKLLQQQRQQQQQQQQQEQKQNTVTVVRHKKKLREAEQSVSKPGTPGASDNSDTTDDKTQKPETSSNNESNPPHEQAAQSQAGSPWQMQDHLPSVGAPSPQHDSPKTQQAQQEQSQSQDSMSQAHSQSPLNQLPQPPQHQQPALEHMQQMIQQAQHQRAQNDNGNVVPPSPQSLDPRFAGPERFPISTLQDQNIGNEFAKAQLRELLVKQQEQKRRRKQEQEQEQMIRDQQANLPLRHWSPDQPPPSQPPPPYPSGPHFPDQRLQFPLPREPFMPPRQPLQRPPFPGDGSRPPSSPGFPFVGEQGQPFPRPPWPDQFSEMGPDQAMRGGPQWRQPFQHPPPRHPNQFIELKRHEQGVPGPSMPQGVQGHQMPPQVPGPPLSQGMQTPPQPVQGHQLPQQVPGPGLQNFPGARNRTPQMALVQERLQQRSMSQNQPSQMPTPRLPHPPGVNPLDPYDHLVKQHSRGPFQSTIQQQSAGPPGFMDGGPRPRYMQKDPSQQPTSFPPSSTTTSFPTIPGQTSIPSDTFGGQPRPPFNAPAQQSEGQSQQQAAMTPSHFQQSSQDQFPGPHDDFDSNPHGEPPLDDDLFKDGEFNILEYADPELDTNRHSEANQQLFKDLGLSEDHDHKESETKSEAVPVTGQQKAEEHSGEEKKSESQQSEVKEETDGTTAPKDSPKADSASSEKCKDGNGCGENDKPGCDEKDGTKCGEQDGSGCGEKESTDCDGKDGNHCGEKEGCGEDSKGCSDGVHCGENEGCDNKGSKECKDGKGCGENDSPVCTDGKHCGENDGTGCDGKDGKNCGEKEGCDGKDGRRCGENDGQGCKDGKGCGENDGKGCGEDGKCDSGSGCGEKENEGKIKVEQGQQNTEQSSQQTADQSQSDLKSTDNKNCDPGASTSTGGLSKQASEPLSSVKIKEEPGVDTEKIDGAKTPSGLCGKPEGCGEHENDQEKKGDDEKSPPGTSQQGQSENSGASTPVPPTARSGSGAATPTTAASTPTPASPALSSGSNSASTTATSLGSATPTSMPTNISDLFKMTSAPATGSTTATNSTTASQLRQSPLQGAMSRRQTLLLQEQPLLLQDLLEKEKMEQMQQQQHPASQPLPPPPPPPQSTNNPPVRTPPTDPFLNDIDFEKLQREAKLFASKDTEGTPGPHAQLLKAMTRQHQESLHQQTSAITPQFQPPAGFSGMMSPRFPAQNYKGDKLPGVPPPHPMSQFPGMRPNMPDKPTVFEDGMPGNQMMGPGGTPRFGFPPKQGTLNIRSPGVPTSAGGMHSPAGMNPMAPNSALSNQPFSAPSPMNVQSPGPGVPSPMGGMHPSNQASGGPSPLGMPSPTPGGQSPRGIPGMTGMVPSPLGLQSPGPSVPSAVLSPGGPQTSGMMPPPPPGTVPPPFPDGDRQQQAQYEEWLFQHQQLLNMQQKFLETEATKHRKKKKSLSARQRASKKNDRPFSENDEAELEAITQQHGQTQKQLEQIRKQQKQHGALIQEYRLKQQEKMQLSMANPQMQGQGPFVPEGNLVRFPGPPPPGMPPNVGPNPQLQSPPPPQGPRPLQPQVHIMQDDNNPFSDEFQQRERREKMARLREQQEKQRLQLLQQVDHARAMQRMEHENAFKDQAEINQRKQQLIEMPFFNEGAIPFTQGGPQQPHPTQQMMPQGPFPPGRPFPAGNQGGHMMPMQAGMPQQGPIPPQGNTIPPMQPGLSGFGNFPPGSQDGGFPVPPSYPGPDMRPPPVEKKKKRARRKKKDEVDPYDLPPATPMPSDALDFGNTQPLRHLDDGGVRANQPGMMLNNRTQMLPMPNENTNMNVPMNPLVQNDNQISASPVLDIHTTRAEGSQDSMAAEVAKLEIEQSDSQSVKSDSTKEDSNHSKDDKGDGKKDSKPLQNLLLKQLLQGPAIYQSGPQPQSLPSSTAASSNTDTMSVTPTTSVAATPADASTSDAKEKSAKPPGAAEDEDDVSNVVLTPEQQKQLEMLEQLPYVKPKNDSDWIAKKLKAGVSDREILMEINRQELERQREQPAIVPEVTQKKKRKVPKHNKVSDKSKKRKASLDDEDGILDESKSLMNAIKQLPLLPLCEPEVSINFSLCPILGSGTLPGENQLRGPYGNATIDGIPDYYSHFPFGPPPPLTNPPTPPASLPPSPPDKISVPMVNGHAHPSELSQRRMLGMSQMRQGHDNSSFLGPNKEPRRYQLSVVPGTDITMTTADEVMKDLSVHQRTITKTVNPQLNVGRDIDIPPSLPTPPPTSDSNPRLSGSDSRAGSTVPSSSPECVEGDEPAYLKGLKVIAKELEDAGTRGPSPTFPILKPTPTRRGLPIKTSTISPLVTSSLPMTTVTSLSMPTTTSSSTPAKSEANSSSVTIELSVTAAEDVKGVVAAVADLLHIPEPNSYEVSGETAEKQAKEESQSEAQTSKKDKPSNLQSLLQAKTQFCRHCDVVVLGEGVRKKPSDFLAMNDRDADIIFCSTSCYMQFAIAQQTQRSVPEHAAAVVNHTSKDPDSKLPSQEQSQTLLKSSLKVQSEMILKEEPKQSNKSHFRRRKNGSEDMHPIIKKWKDIRWKKWHISILPPKKYKPHCEEDIDDLMNKLGTSLQAYASLADQRKCVFCGELGDGSTDGPARLLNMDVDVWVHLNCALWSAEVYETLNGALINVEQAHKRGVAMKCCYCSKIGATVGCHKFRCTNIYHFGCAIRDKCIFFKDKTMLCPLHCPSRQSENELRTHIVYRRVYISRDENKQVASIMHQGEKKHTLRIGSLIFHSVGQLLPHQLQVFHSQTAIYPVGFETTRLYWSMRYTNKRCRYVCSIHDHSGKPEFCIRVIEQGHDDVVIKDCTCLGVWSKVMEPIERLRRDADMLKLFPSFITGEDLFGLTEPSILRVIESLPGVEGIQGYIFRFGRSPLIELPLAINPTGCARSEPRMRTYIKRPHTLTSNSSSGSYQSTVTGDLASPYTKQFAHSKSSQYRRLKQEWRNNVNLARSRIQGLGLFAARDIEKHTMVIEYIGTIIRNEVANRREQLYEEANRGVYMFRINSDYVIDATLTGGPARYINHSCAPNCVAEVVTFEKGEKIIIISNRRIAKGEELTYDYKFDFEDDQNKITCMCKAPNCRKWMN